MIDIIQKIVQTILGEIQRTKNEVKRLSSYMAIYQMATMASNNISHVLYVLIRVLILYFI